MLSLSFSINFRSDVEIGLRPGIKVSSGPRPGIELSSGPRPGIELSSGPRPGTEWETESSAELVSSSSSRPEKKAVSKLPVISWSDEDGTKL